MASIQAETETHPSESELFQHLRSQGYLMIMAKGPDRWVALYPFMFTWAIIEGAKDSLAGYEDRWCYASFQKAVDGLNEWLLRGFEGEPAGWHRHPATGRRRPDGDQTQEYINV